MRRMLFVSFVVGLCSWVGVLFSADRLCAQSVDMDLLDERISAPVVPEIEIQEESEGASESSPAFLMEESGGLKVREDKEIKYVAGKDGLWFTEDDEVYQYYFVEYGDDGNVTQKTTLTVGPDNTIFTPDDILQDYQTFDYDADGKVLKEVFFNGNDVSQHTVEYTYDETGKKLKTIRYDLDHQEIRAMAFAYDDRGLLTQDVEYVAKDIEKYHRFEYDKRKKLIKAMEFHRDHHGSGPDGAWFTADDVISSAKEFIYDQNGSKSKELKFIESGPDGQWFTDDDVLQYYTLFYHR